ncbi:MAG: TonB-dependent receptor, partial [Bacteroidales bacterium]|nr:TonB-dependent receptor [Bacteroidales bacterium]
GFFIPDTSTVFQNTLTVTFDNIKKLRFSGEASYKLTNKINIGTRLLFDQYTMDSLTKAWHMPGFQMHFIAGYQFDEKLRLKSELMFQDKRYAPSYVNGIENLVALKPVTDINLGAEYAINEQFTVFAQVNNLLHNRYERYYMYPVQGIQLFAGMSLRF